MHACDSVPLVMVLRVVTARVPLIQPKILKLGLPQVRGHFPSYLAYQLVFVLTSGEESAFAWNVISRY